MLRKDNLCVPWVTVELCMSNFIVNEDNAWHQGALSNGIGIALLMFLSMFASPLPKKKKTVSIPRNPIVCWLLFWATSAQVVLDH